ncbi:leucine-rich repeat-containing 63 [Labeo rohita]|uniref:Leucine-rich repeat-containing 63 n=1 Tax=Labeo rohita TaxID=84645 RepID=A0A498MDH0_LABRO|nr:leucine-rich repeat-containing 63 [Labeo rohita]
MSSEHMKLLRRPLPPIKTTHYRTPPAPKSAGHDEVSEFVCSPQTLHEDHDDVVCRVAPVISGFSHHPQRAAPAPPQPRPPALFCLNDFLQVSGSGRGSEDGLRTTVLSRCNYRKLLRLFLLELHCGWQDAVANQTLSCEGLPPPTRRIPRRQIICAHEVLLNAVTSKHFQDSRRSRSPFRCAGERDVINASELAVLDCVTRGGTTLSFKVCVCVCVCARVYLFLLAHFICDLPDVSSLSDRLQYLNVSFNHLTRVPQEVCDLHQLRVLKMRNNPIEELPAQISKLHKLQTLVVSFCKIPQLPDQSLSSAVKQLRSLRCLKIEGNELVSLPVGLLRVPVSELRMSGNYTHPLLWSENSCNSPQTLLHTAAHTLTHTPQRYTQLPHAAHILLNSAGVCDVCTGPMFGAGLKLIRPVRGVFGLPLVPVMFFCCSPACLHRFRNQTNIISQQPDTV